MALEPRPPSSLNEIAGLEHAAMLAARSAAHKPGVAALMLGQQRQDRVRLAMRAQGQHYPAIGPVYGHGSVRRQRGMTG